MESGLSLLSACLELAFSDRGSAEEGCVSARNTPSRVALAPGDRRSASARCARVRLSSLVDAARIVYLNASFIHPAALAPDAANGQRVAGM